MKNLIFVFVLIVAVSCDVSEIVQGDGWFKDANGYHYDIPAERFFEDAPAEEPVAVSDPVFTPEESACPNGGSGPYCCINGSESEDCGLTTNQDYVEIIEYIDVPVDDLREYLPPVQDAKRKRQIPVRRQAKQIRKIYRKRFVKRH